MTTTSCVVLCERSSRLDVASRSRAVSVRAREARVCCAGSMVLAWAWSSLSWNLLQRELSGFLNLPRSRPFRGLIARLGGRRRAAVWWQGWGAAGEGRGTTQRAALEHHQIRPRTRAMKYSRPLVLVISYHEP